MLPLCGHPKTMLCQGLAIRQWVRDTHKDGLRGDDLQILDQFKDTEILVSEPWSSFQAHAEFVDMVINLQRLMIKYLINSESYQEDRGSSTFPDQRESIDHVSNFAGHIFQAQFGVVLNAVVDIAMNVAGT